MAKTDAGNAPPSGMFLVSVRDARLQRMEERTVSSLSKRTASKSAAAGAGKGSLPLKTSATSGRHLNPPREPAAAHGKARDGVAMKPSSSTPQATIQRAASAAVQPMVNRNLEHPHQQQGGPSSSTLSSAFKRPPSGASVFGGQRDEEPKQQSHTHSSAKISPQENSLKTGTQGNPAQGASMSHLSSNNLSYGYANGARVGESPRLPEHLSGLLNDPTPMLPPPQDGDVATSLALQGAREAGGELCFSMKGLLRLPVEMERFMRVEGLNLRSINLRGNRLAEVPSLDQVRFLTSLDISSNCLVSLPLGLDHCTELKTLNLAENTIQALPPLIACLKSLTSLDLASNALEELPVGLFELNRLQHIKLDRNRLHCIPAPLLRLPDLRTLSASHNQIVSISSDLSSLQQLESLNLHHNLITALPDTIGVLRCHLTELQLHENCLTVLPRQFVQLNRLQTITIAGNPLIFPPQDVCRRGLAAIRSFLMQHVDHWEDQKVHNDQLASDKTVTSSEEPLEEDEGPSAAAAEDPGCHKEEGGCPRCEQALGHAEVMGTNMLRLQLERERIGREVAALKEQLLQRDKQCAQLDNQVRELISEKLSSERNLHNRSAQHLASAEDHERQVIQTRIALREAEGQARAAQSLLAEARDQLEAQRRDTEAAIRAAGDARRDEELVASLKRELEAKQAEINRLGELVAHHHFEQRVCEDRQAEAEACRDQVQAALVLAREEQLESHRLMASERAAAALQAAEASSRESSLRIDNENLRSRLDALMAERDALTEVSRTPLNPLLRAEEQRERDGRGPVMAPTAEVVAAERRALVTAASVAAMKEQWLQPRHV